MKSISSLVDELYQIRQRRKADEERDREITACLVVHGPGELKGSSGVVAQVRFPSPKIVTPSDDKLAEIRAEVGGSNFEKLYEPRWYPIKQFRAVLEALVSKIKARKVLELVEVESKPYVCFP